MEKAVEDDGACLEPMIGGPDLRGAHAVLKGWYHHTSAMALNPSRSDMAEVTGEYTVLYWRK